MLRSRVAAYSRYFSVLWRVSVAAISALVTYGFLWSIYGWVRGDFQIGQLSPVGFVVIVFGSIPVLIYGSPLYALLQMDRIATWYSSLVIGLAPGLTALLIREALEPAEWRTGEGSLDIILFIGIHGVAVALLTHVLFQYWVKHSRR